jgi:adenylylsulfate kinase
MGKIIWFTGMSGAGKSTLAKSLESNLLEKSFRVINLDGDIIREKINYNLDFSAESIRKNHDSILTLCQDLMPNYDFILVSVIAPFRESRAKARNLLRDNYIEIYTKASIDELIRRDTKGLYAKAQNLIINNLIGFSENSPYEVPTSPNLIIDTESENITSATEKILLLLN